MKPSFEVIDSNLELMMSLSTDADDFCALWQKYLTTNGWDEESYEKELNRRVFGTSN